MTTIFCNDDTGAFGQTLLTIDLYNPSNFKISKAEFRCGKVLKVFSQPVFPLKINLTAEETSQLSHINTTIQPVLSNPCYLAVYDEEGRKKTLDGSITLGVRKCVV